MKVFLSHVAYDEPLARYLKRVFAEELGVEMLMAPDDIQPGAMWMDRFRELVAECDELVSLATPESVERPWIAAEWSCFWLMSKRCTPILVDVDPARLWEPMRAHHFVDLLNPTLSIHLLGRYRSVVAKSDALEKVARRVAQEVPGNS